MKVNGRRTVSVARCLKALENNQERDPKYQKVLEYLIHQNWIERGCIIFLNILILSGGWPISFQVKYRMNP